MDATGAASGGTPLSQFGGSGGSSGHAGHATGLSPGAFPALAGLSPGAGGCPTPSMTWPVTSAPGYPRPGSVSPVRGDLATQNEAQLKIMRSDMNSLHSKLQQMMEQVETVKVNQRSVEDRADKVREDNDMANMGLCQQIAEVQEDLKKQKADNSQMISSLQSMWGDLVKRIDKEASPKDSPAASREAELQQRVDRLEGMLDRLHGDHSASHADALESLKSAEVRITEGAMKRDRDTAELAQRLDGLKGEMKSLSGLSMQALKETADRLQQVQSRLTTCEESGSNLSDVRELCVELPRWKESLEERMTKLKGMLENLAEAHKKHAEGLEQGNMKVYETLKSANAKLNAHIEKETQARDRYHICVQERLQQLESIISKSATTHAEVVDATLPQLEDIFSRLADCEARSDGGDLAERVEQLEHLLRGAHEKHAQELKALTDAHSQVQEQVGRIKKAHADEVGAVKGASGTSPEDVERMQRLERLIEESHGKYSGLLDSHKDEKGRRDSDHAEVRSSIEKMQGHTEQHKQTLQELSARVEALQSDLSAEQAQREKQGESLTRLQHTLGQTAGSLQEAEAALRAAQGANSSANELKGRLMKLESVIQESMHTQISMATKTHNELEELKDLRARVMGDAEFVESKASVMERLEYMERVMGEHSDYLQRHDEGVQATVAGHGQLQERLEQVERSFAGHSEEVGAHRVEQDRKHGSMSDLLSQAEQRLAEDLANLREELGGEKKLRSQTLTTMAERLEAEGKARGDLETDLKGKLYVEKQTREAMEKWVKDHVSREKAAREADGEHLKDLLKTEKSAREKLLANHEERLAYETQQREVGDKNLQEQLRREAEARQETARQIKKEQEDREASVGKAHDEVAQERMSRTQAIQELRRQVAEIAADPRASASDQAMLDALRREAEERAQVLAVLEQAIKLKMEANVRETAEQFAQVRTESKKLGDFLADIAEKVDNHEAFVISSRPRAGTGEAANSGPFHQSPLNAVSPAPPAPVVPAAPAAPAATSWPEASGAQTMPVRKAEILGYNLSSPQSAPAAHAFPGGGDWPPAASPGFGGDAFGAAKGWDMVDRSNTSTPTRQRTSFASPDPWGGAI